MKPFRLFIEEIGDPLRSGRLQHPAPHFHYGDHTDPHGFIKLHGLTRAKATANKAPVTAVPVSTIRATNRFLGKKLGKADPFPDHEAPVFARVQGKHYIMDGHKRLAKLLRGGRKEVMGHVYHIRREEL